MNKKLKRVRLETIYRSEIDNQGLCAVVVKVTALMAEYKQKGFINLKFVQENDYDSGYDHALYGERTETDDEYNARLNREVKAEERKVQKAIKDKERKKLALAEKKEKERELYLSLKEKFEKEK